MLNTNRNERAPLYPLLFDVYYKNVIWGGNGFETYLNRSIPVHSAPAGEAWEICDRPEVSSRVMNGALSGISLHDLLLLYGEQLVGKRDGDGLRNFPVMIKWIDATQDNSLQVHPDQTACDRIGQEAEPKSELWYVYQCSPGSRIIASWQKKCTEKRLRSLLDHPDKVRDYLKIYESVPGDVFQIFPGCIHSIGKGNFIFEIQENSVTTFRITDWNRLDANGERRTLHVDESMQSIDFDHGKVARTSTMDERCLQNIPCVLTSNHSPFCVEELLLTADFEDDTRTADSFHLITPLDAPLIVECENCDPVTIPRGRTVLLGADQGIYRLRLVPPSETEPAPPSNRLLRTTHQ